MEYQELIDTAKEASIEAGKAILEVYNADERGIEFKEDDSPLTLADKNAHEVIMKHLVETGLPVLSEEGAKIPFSERKNWKKFWMVDPLDGTKEFIKRNDEFTVNIALIEEGKAIAGVVYIPVLEELFWGNVHEGKAFFQTGNSEVTPLLDKSSRKEIWTVAPGHKANCSKATNDPVRIVCSRSHMNSETLEFIEQFHSIEKMPMGSSLKFLRIAQDVADMYPRFGPTMEWDTAAAHGVLSACGYQIKDAVDYNELNYNKENLLNPTFVAF